MKRILSSIFLVCCFGSVCFATSTKDCNDYLDCTSCRSAPDKDCYWLSDLDFCSNRRASWLVHGNATCTDLTCEGCLELGGAWAEGCVESCHGYPNCKQRGDGQTCAQVNTNNAAFFTNFDICYDQDDTNCETCTSTKKLDGRSCSWSWRNGRGRCNHVPSAGSIDDIAHCAVFSSFLDLIDTLENNNEGKKPKNFDD